MGSDANPIILVGGKSYKSFTRVTVSASAKQAVRAFGLTVTDNTDGAAPWADQWNFMPQTPIEIREGSDQLLAGFIDRMSPSFDHGDHKVEISGRSRSGDTVDSSVDHPTGEFRNKSTLEIAKALDMQNVGFHSDEQLEKHDYFRVNPYESVFSAVERLARKEQLLIHSRPDGGIQLAKGGTTSVNAPLVEGGNIIAASAVFDDGDRASGYKVKGQRALGVNRKAIQISAESKDGGVKRNRPKHVHHEGDADQKHAQKRADHHRDRQMGESISANVRVQGWRDENGLLYQINTLIFVYSPMLKLNMSMLIDTVEVTQEESGSFTQIGLVHPKALGSDASTGSKTDAAWNPGF